LVVAVIALLVALGGSGYAAVALTLPANSVGTAQLKSNAVVSSKVKDHSLLKADFASGQIPAGPRGAPGAPGPPGAAGAKGATGPAGPSGTSATKWALVGRDGQLVAGSSTSIVITQTGPGEYYVNFGAPLTGHGVSATPAFRSGDVNFRGTLIVGICGNTGASSPADTIACPFNNNTNTLFVSATDTDNQSQANHPFYVVVF
jgi:hypothetical protein